MSNFNNQSNQEPSSQKEGVIRASLQRLNRSLIMMHKTQVRIWQAMLITVFIAGFASALILAVSQDWLTKIIGAPSTITNQAQVNYEDEAGTPYSGQSNSVTTTVGGGQPTPKIRIRIQLEERPSNFASSITLYIYQAGTTNLVLQVSGVSSALGDIEIDAASLSSGSYDLKAVISYHLSVSLRSVSFAGQDISLEFAKPKSGNLTNDDDVINSRDWAIMSGRWGSNDPVADINGDGMVNTLDWGLMNKNWLAIGN